MKRQILLGILILLFIQTLAVAGDTYYVSSRDYPTIQSAINATLPANDDVVVVAPGIWTGAGNVNLDFSQGLPPGQTRAITVKSEINPNNPNPAIIAATIIDCGGEPTHNPLSDSGAWNRAFWFHSNEDPNSKVLGFTIRNGYARGPKGADGVFGYDGFVDATHPISLFIPIPPCAVDDPNNCPPYALNGDNRSGDGYGGAILCQGASSPTIQYCVISNCTVTGAHGGDGADGLWGIWFHWTLADIDPCYGVTDVNIPPTENPDGQWAGSGGYGSGNGYGGAIACRGNSNPIISDCIISDNFARGGCGGDGGNGGYAYAEPPDPEYDDGLEGGGGDAGNSIGNGIGGGIYSDGGSSPVITNCTFSNDIAMTGIRGTGGERGLGEEDDPRAFLGLDGEVYSTGGIAGGAAYYHASSNPNFTNCTFTSNKAYEAKRYKQSVPWPPYPGEDISAYTVGGALYSFRNSGVNLDNCKFISNLGGAVYCGTGCNLDFDDCLFADNSESTNGGALYIDTGCTVNIQGCIFGGNSAYDDGGALKCKSDITLTNCSFGNNRADSDNDGYGYGGAMDAYDDQYGTTLIIDVNACSFAGNRSVYGGGFSSENFDANFTDCYFIGNTAQRGGGLDLVDGDISVTGGVVNGNNATDGDGGGFNCSYTKAEIRDCTISDNFADGVYPAGGSGGAINFYGWVPTQVVFNCLLTGNFATINGGAIFCRNATPEIGNCTFSGNFASDYGGAIFSDWASDPQITDAIFRNNNSHAIHEEDSGGDALVTFSLFFNNPDGDYYDSGTGMTYSGSGQVGSIPGGSNNLYGDPLFVSGPLGEFYLNQTLSPAVDSGSDTAANLVLHTYTTDPLNVLDSGQVDRGYHYIDISDVGTFQLTASVIGDHGTVAPTAPPPVDYNAVTDTYTYYAGTVVTLTATPDAGWRVKAWSGTDDDSSTATTNSVVMNSARDVTVEFKQPQTFIVAVGGGGEGFYSNITDALHDAEDGDTIVVYPGVYYGPQVQVNKDVEIRSQNPDDPNWVAQTIIDSTGQAGPVFWFDSGRGPGCILNGFTIQNSTWYTDTGDDAENVGQNGEDGPGAAGGAIFIYSGASPVIKNSIIRDNFILGGFAGTGADADATHNAGRGGWGGWARGGAIYCGINSSPQFINCQILDNQAVGGIGGNGGAWDPDGGSANYGGNWSRAEWWNRRTDSLVWEWVQGDLWEVWLTTLETDPYIVGPPYIGDYRWYSGYGGGVFIDEGSNVTFVNCTISGNLAQGGLSGLGGDEPGAGPYRAKPFPLQYEIPSFGGGVYCTADSTVTFTDCTITDNVSSDPLFDHIAASAGYGADDLTTWIQAEYDPCDTYSIDPYLGHGGGVCAEDTATVIFTDCTFSGNKAAVGGGIHFANANLQISDCNFTSNLAYQGGGLFGERGPVTILRSNFTNNEAVSDPNDPNVVILGEGGGIHFGATEADIIDCNISSNQAEASGGGAYFGGEGTSFLTNCLLTKNTAGRDGGGVSANIFTQLTVFNCTIADNAVTGVGFQNAFGGGLYVSYESDVNVIDSIIWSNFAIKGPQVAVGTGFEYDQAPSKVTVSYCDIGPLAGLIDFEAGEPFWADWDQNDGATLIDAQTIYDQFGVDGWAEVIVSLFEPVELRRTTDWTSPESVAVLREEIDGRQDSVLSTLTPAEFTLRHRFENQTGFSGEVTIGGLNKLFSNSLVAYIEPVRYVERLLAQAIPLANALEARQLYDGTGIAVAIVDDGVDYTHPRLGGGGFPNAKVIGGYDTAENDADPMHSALDPETGHGTSVAGIAAGDLGTVGDYIGGVAPGAKIYALKIWNDDGVSPTDSDLAAWDWCVTHQNDDPDNPIMVMSNSWAIWGLPFNYPAIADAFSPAMTVAADTAVAAGITILAGSGNDGFAGNGITWPAAMSNVISVGAVDDVADTVMDYSNTTDILDILAPADPIYTTDIVGVNGYDLGDYFPYFNGTSAACPFAAGAVASIQSAAMAEWGYYLNPEQVRAVLVVSGVPVTDTKVNITKPRVNLAAAISYLVTPSIYVEEGCTFIGWDPNAVNVGDWDPNFSEYANISESPLFVDGYLLSQTEAGQEEDSPCVDAGSDFAINLGLNIYTTRTDRIFDKGIVDMGYHYPLALAESCRISDLVLDGVINFKDFAVFAWNWLRDDCSGDNGWCDGADLTFDTRVDIDDLLVFAGCWLVIDNNAPVPNPSEWAIEPYSSSMAPPYSISMTAETTVDTWGGDVEYYFECVSGNCDDSGWQEDPNYENSNLVPGAECGYKVRARDASEQILDDGTGEPGNKTGWSLIRYAVVGEEEDHNPPIPNPMTWAVPSYTATQDSITLFATTAIDDTADVEYYFENFVFPGVNSGWIANPTWTDVGLMPNTTYTYRVRARDTSPWQNETNWSLLLDANTLAEGEEPPELQAPVIVGANQVEVGFYWHHVITARATAEDPLYFRFVCLDQPLMNSAWVPRVGNAVDTFDHPVVPDWPDATITRGSDVITYDIAVGVSWNLWQWQVCGSNEEDYDPALCSATVAMPQPP